MGMEKKGNGTERRKKRTGNRALVSWRKLKCRWLGILLSFHTSVPIPKAPSLISLASHFSLRFFFISFPPIPLFYLSLQFPFIVYLVLHSVLPHLYQPHSFLSVLVYLSDPNYTGQWILSLAMSFTLKRSSNPWPEERSSLFLDLITPPASGYDTLEQSSCCTLVQS